MHILLITYLIQTGSLYIYLHTINKNYRKDNNKLMGIKKKSPMVKLLGPKNKLKNLEQFLK